jgi:serine/threonine protein phosphatase 1
MARLIAVGDIHGQYQLLIDLIADVRPSADDQFVFLGDYVDRGSDTAAVIDWLIDFQQKFPATKFLRGNHEQMLLDAHAAALRNAHGANNFVADFLSLRNSGLPPEVHFFISCGGEETLLSYQNQHADYDPCAVLQNLPEQHLLFVRKTRFYYLRHPFLFVHAGVDPKDPRGEKNDNQAFLWERRPLWKADNKWKLTVVHGHTPVASPYFDNHEISLDTGAGYGDRLTACDVLTRQIWQASY